MSCGSKKKEPWYACMSESLASHSQRMEAEVSSSAPLLLHNALSDNPIRWRFLFRVLRRPVTDLDCFLLKEKNLALAPRQGSEINARTCLWLSQRPRQHIQYWLTNQRVILLRIAYLQTAKAGLCPTNLEHNRSLQAGRRSRYLVPQHVQRPSKTSTHVGPR